MTRKTPLVTVIIPVYNAGQYLLDAVNSVLRQSYSNLEILVVDDGSTDGCLDYLEGIQDGRLRIISQENAGKAVAMNTALDQCEGEFFLIQDADDCSYPQRIEKQLNYLLEHNDLAAVFVGHDFILGHKQFAPRLSSKSVEQCRQDVEQFRIPAHDATGMYRMALTGRIRFDPELRIGQGVDYILRVGESYPMALLGECLYTYRVDYRSTIRRDPLKTIQMTKLVREKALRRRDMPMEKSMQARSPVAGKRLYDTGVIPHLMESVLDLRRVGRRFEALQVGWEAIKMGCWDPFYYKPMLYAVLPEVCIHWYRKWKQSKHSVVQ